MRLAISNIAWPAGADAEVAPLLRRHGVAGVELAPTKVWPQPLDVSETDARAYRASWEERGMRIAALQALLYGKPDLVVFGDEATRQRTRDHLVKMIERAGWLGARALVFGSPKNRQRQGRSASEALSIAVPFFRALGAAARQHGVYFCIEPNPPQYGCDFVTTVAEGIELVDAVGEEGFGLHLDTAGMRLAGDPVAASIEAAGSRCKHFHVSAPYLGEVGGEECLHRACVPALHESGYADWISIEMGEPKEAGAWPGSVERALAFVSRTYFANTEPVRTERN